MAGTVWAPGDVIENRYEILDQIGLGGMGVVWKIHHREWDRVLALKMPLAHLVSSPALRERFVREAETWVGLGVHPHIVQCWYVLNISGLPCLFLDFMTGGSLKDLQQAGKIGPGQWPEIMDLSMQIAQGLGHAHSRGVIHRDIKPENLLFRDQNRICVTDFGLVKTVAAEDELRRSESGLEPAQGGTVSGVGAFLGTPQYGAPEQWGSAERVGPGADVYALGITLYELCCGRRPYDQEGESVHYGDLITAHLSVAPPDPREFHPQVPEELARFSLRCLEKNPSNRPHSMEQFQQELGAIYQKMTGKVFHGVPSLPRADNPDVLNNMAVSFRSLEKTDDARRLLQRALRVEPDHSEALYNLSQIERREGRIGMQEALRRLQQAKLNYPLALLCIEQGLGKEAAIILSEIDTEDPIKKGLVQRAIGDAQMYAHQYFAAEKAYQTALKLMPNDQQSAQRKSVAVQGRRDSFGHILFPLPGARLSFASGGPQNRILVSDDSTKLFGISDRDLWILDVETEQVESRVDRLQDARPVDQAWIAGQRLVMQERGAFQLRMLPDLRMIGRKGGLVLAQAHDLSRMVLLSREGPSLYVGADNAFHNISKAEQTEGQNSLLAAFDPTGQLLCLLLPSGRVAQLDESYEALPLAWPSRQEIPTDATALALSRTGVLYVGRANGEVKVFDMATQTVSANYKLPGPIHGLQLISSDRCLLANLGGMKVLLDEHGQTVWQGPGPLVVDPSGDRILFFFKGQLHLYQIAPFQMVRRWEQSMEQPVGLELARNGGIAVSWDRAGNVALWEVDENHRVFERSLLLSPGRSYDDLVAGAQTFPAAIDAVKTSIREQQWLEAYRQLLKARAVSGYGQQPDALDLNWLLVKVMSRDRLDAIWDRQTLSGKAPRNVDIAPTEGLYLATFDREVSVLSDTAQGSNTLWTVAMSERVLVARFVARGEGPPTVLVVDSSGTGCFLESETGTTASHFRLDSGKLRDARLADRQLLFATDADEVGIFDTQAGKLLAKSAPLAERPRAVYPWVSEQVIVVGESGFGTLALGRKPGHSLEPFSPKAYQPTAKVTYASLDVQHKVIVLGLEDGTLAITDAASGKLVYAISKVSGAVTGFSLVTDLNVGVVSTDRGQLYFWDLIADRVLEGILAHRGGILDLASNTQGRFMITSGRDGQVRIWETSWTVSLSLEQRPRLDWLPSEGALSKLARFFRRG